MDLPQLFLKIANGILSFVMIVALLISGSYATYALWDNNTVYAAAENVQAEMVRLKPKPTGSNTTDFEDLLAVNPDVRAWLTLDNTNIDYPILQGETTMTYINMDVYGNFSLAGSIFMDTRSDGGFHDPYTLIYGHDMVKGQMFGDLARYKNQKFFEANSNGSLILPDRSYLLTIYACMIVKSSDQMIFNPSLHNVGLSRLIEYVQANALYLRDDMTYELKKTSESGVAQILSLTTCSSEFTDARTIILAVMEPTTPAE